MTAPKAAPSALLSNPLDDGLLKMHAKADHAKTLLNQTRGREGHFPDSTRDKPRWCSTTLLITDVSIITDFTVSK